MRCKKTKNRMKPMGVLAITLMLMLSILTGCASSPVEIPGESIGVEYAEKENPSVAPTAPEEAPGEAGL